MTSKLFWSVSQIICFVLALSGCSGKQTADNEYLSKSAKAVVFFSTSSESFFRNLSADPKENKSDSFERYSQLLLDNFMACTKLGDFQELRCETEPHGSESNTGCSESACQTCSIAQTGAGNVLRIQEFYRSD